LISGLQDVLPAVVLPAAFFLLTAGFLSFFPGTLFLNTFIKISQS